MVARKTQIRKRRGMIWISELLASGWQLPHHRAWEESNQALLLLDKTWCTVNNIAWENRTVFRYLQVKVSSEQFTHVCTVILARKPCYCAAVRLLPRAVHGRRVCNENLQEEVMKWFSAFSDACFPARSWRGHVDKQPPCLATCPVGLCPNVWTASKGSYILTHGRDLVNPKCPRRPQPRHICEERADTLFHNCQMTVNLNVWHIHLKSEQAQEDFACNFEKETHMLFALNSGDAACVVSTSEWIFLCVPCCCLPLPLLRTFYAFVVHFSQKKSAFAIWCCEERSVMGNKIEFKVETCHKALKWKANSARKIWSNAQHLRAQLIPEHSLSAAVNKGPLL